MKKDRKAEIIIATLMLASEMGLGAVSMSMIAEKVGIRKASLYNHFASKEEIVDAMYGYLREQAKEKINVSNVDYGSLVQGKQASEVLIDIVTAYQKLNNQKYMQMFYRVICSERSFEPMAAKIMAEETEKMILATKQLFYAMQIHGLLNFSDVDMSAISFAMTIHAMIDYEIDKRMAYGIEENRQLIDYITWFCRENSDRRSK